MDLPTPSQHSHGTGSPSSPVKTPDQWDDRWRPELAMQQVPVLQVPAPQWQLPQGMVPIAVPFATLDQPALLAQHAALTQRITELESRLDASQSHNLVLEARLRVAELEAQLGSTEAVNRQLETRYTELESSRLAEASQSQQESGTCSMQCEALDPQATGSPVQITATGSGHARSAALATDTESKDDAHCSSGPWSDEEVPVRSETLEANVTQSLVQNGMVAAMLETDAELVVQQASQDGEVRGPVKSTVSQKLAEVAPCVLQRGLSSEVEKSCKYNEVMSSEAEPSSKEPKLPADSLPGEKSDSEDRATSFKVTESKELELEPSRRTRPRKRNAAKRGCETDAKQHNQQGSSSKKKGVQFERFSEYTWTSAARAVVSWSTAYQGGSTESENQTWVLRILAFVALCVALLCIALFPKVVRNNAVPLGDNSNNSESRAPLSLEADHVAEVALASNNVQNTVVQAESVITFGSLGDDKFKWWSGVRAPNGFIYGIPSSASQVLKIDPSSDRFSLFGDLGTEKFKWVASVIAKNGIIYGIPAAAGTVLRIDPSSDSIRYLGKYRKFDSKWTSAVLSACGSLIYGIPNAAAAVLKIDTTSDRLRLLSLGKIGASKFKWTSGVLATNGAIYGIPANIGVVLKIDPISDNVTFLGNLPNQRNKWFAGVLAANGAIYAIPNNARSVLKINPEADTVELLGDIGNATFKYMTGVVARSGMIYGIPFDASAILLVNPVTDTVETFGAINSSGSMWRSAELGVNGEIFAIPFSASQILVIDPRSQEFGFCGSFNAGTQWRFGATASNGYLYGIPVSADAILKIDTSNRSMCRGRCQ